MFSSFFKNGQTPGYIMTLDEVEDQPTISPTTESLLDQPALEDSNEVAPVTISPLNSIIPKINDPLIRRRTSAVNDALLNLPKDDETLKKIEQHSHCTYQALTAPPGKPRQEAHAELKKLATKAKNSSSPAWQYIGSAMILLGAFIIEISLIFLYTGFYPATPLIFALLAVGGGLVIAGGGLAIVGAMSNNSKHTSGQPEDRLYPRM
jgi:hypothetical protein